MVRDNRQNDYIIQQHYRLQEKREHNLGGKDFAADENNTAGYYQTQVLNHSKEKNFLTQWKSKATDILDLSLGVQVFAQGIMLSWKKFPSTSGPFTHSKQSQSMILIRKNSGPALS